MLTTIYFYTDRFLYPSTMHPPWAVRSWFLGHFHTENQDFHKQQAFSSHISAILLMFRIFRHKTHGIAVSYINRCRNGFIFLTGYRRTCVIRKQMRNAILLRGCFCGSQIYWTDIFSVVEPSSTASWYCSGYDVRSVYSVHQEIFMAHKP